MAFRSTATVCSLLGGLGALLAPCVALADEAFLCGPSTVVYVKADEIEQKKKTDPCIAGYFGLTVEAGAQAHSNTGAAPAQAKVRRVVAARPALRTLEGPERTEPVADRSLRSASLLQPEASPGTDFRNVRIINAATDDARWFRHDK